VTTRSSWSRYQCPAGIGFMHSKKLPVLSDADAAALAKEYAVEIRARRQAPAAAADWISLVYRLPDGLRQVLLDDSIGETCWWRSQNPPGPVRDASSARCATVSTGTAGPGPRVSSGTR